jgi:peptide/nickel transport system ATP-binding protein/oligopeptide transport system ATP-binding protein
MSDTLLEVKNLKTYFPVKGGLLKRTVGNVHAVDGVSLTVRKGESLGLVGESGCGKSTLGRTILRLEDPTAGEIWFNGNNITALGHAAMKPVRRDMQLVFQDPFGSLDPRMSVQKIVEEPLKLHKIGSPRERAEKAIAMLRQVGLGKEALSKYPHEFSGGQRQRMGIARALMLNPKLVIADEPVAALDVSIRSQVLNLMNDLKREYQLTYIMISHDLAVVKYFSDRIAVMYLGKIVELAGGQDLYQKALHPYTRALISAIPEPDPTFSKKREVLQGDVPSPLRPPVGCRFNTRCSYATDKCRAVEPELRDYGTSQEPHWVACHRIGEI